MPASSHSLQKRDARATSAFPLIATTSKMRRHVSKVPKPEVAGLRSSGDSDLRVVRPAVTAIRLTINVL
jgi:hypothetical protein